MASVTKGGGIRGFFYLRQNLNVVWQEEYLVLQPMSI